MTRAVLSLSVATVGRRSASVRQRGFALAYALTALFLGAIAIAVTAATSVALTESAALDGRQQAYLRDAQARLADWYRSPAILRSADLVDNFPFTAAQALTGAGVTPQWGVRFAAGPILANGRLRYRRLALWIPTRPNDASVFDAAGVFRPDPAVRRWTVFSSEQAQQAALAVTQDLLGRLAQLAEQRFRVKFDVDPAHAVTRNWFRNPFSNDPAACVDDPDVFPCADLPLKIEDLKARNTDVFGASFRASTYGDRNGWGLPVYLDNAVAPNVFAAPPFSMTFSTATPWGDTIAVRATQEF